MEALSPQEQNNLDLYSIISSSFYSPMTLRHLPQPVPNDLPPGLDAKLFTFQDAFEDLLVASKGEKLPDIRSRYEQRQLLSSMFPSGEPTWFWLRRIESQGLVRQPDDPFTYIRVHQPDWAAFHEELDKKAANAWKSVKKGYKAEDDNASYFYEEMSRAMKDLERGMFGDSTCKDNTSSADLWSKHREGPDNFDELFSEISSAFKGSTSPWDTLLRIVTKDGNGDLGDETRSPPTDRDKKDVLTTEKEHVDRFGYLHKTVTRKALDAEGKQVGLETYVTIRPADKHINNDNKEESDQRSSSDKRNNSKSTN